MIHSFDTLSLRPELQEALQQVGFVEMTPIQARALPPALAGRDLSAQAQTGSGKTAAFGFCLLQALDVELREPQALVLCPTRELAEQVATELRRFAARMADVRILTLCGGRSTRDQRQGLDGGAHVIVGTPGRVEKHLRDHHLRLGRLSVLVLDEADRMLDMGFIDQVDAILSYCPSQRQTLLFSATFPDGVEALQARMQRDPLRVVVETQVDPTLLRQVAVRCRPDQRQAMVARLLAQHRPDSALVFCETRDDCDALSASLSALGASALALHGQLSQEERDDVLVQLLHGSLRVLVATNVAARGLDIPALPLVILSELSPDPESHVHRIGRTGRAGEPGLAISVVASDRENERLERIEAFMGQALERGEAPGESTDLSALQPLNRSLLILAGREQKISKGDVLGALVKEAGLPADAIGRIDLGRKTCAVAIRRDLAQRALKAVQKGRIKKQRVRATLLGPD